MVKSSRKTGGQPFSSAKPFASRPSQPRKKPTQLPKESLPNTSHQLARDLDTIHDVYEYTEALGNRRHGVTSDLTRDEMAEMKIEKKFTSADTESDPDQGHLRRIGMLDDDDVVRSEDDEEIDSDEAFGESDDDDAFAFVNKHRGQESDESQDAEDVDIDVFSVASDVEVPDGSLDALDAFVCSLPVLDHQEGVLTTERRAERSRLAQPERTETVPEGEFAAPSSSSGKVLVQDLISSLDLPGTSVKAIKALKQSAKAFSSSSAETRPLPAPLPLRIQERLDRQAAYEETQTEAAKWVPTMKLIEAADHLTFPLQTALAASVPAADLQTQFAPTTTLETAIDRLLKSGRTGEGSEISSWSDALPSAEPTLDAARARQAELRRARELLSRAQTKARRAAKIKSKTYRKLRRKEKEDQGLSIEELLPSEQSDINSQRLQRETERAKERASLRHKNGSKWARESMAGFGNDLGKRKDVKDMLHRSEELRRKIAGNQPSDEKQTDSDSDQDVAGIRHHALDELQRLDEVTPAHESRAPTGVFGMKFMQDAMDRQIRDVDESLDRFRKEMGDLSDAGDDHPMTDRNHGRLVYQPAAFITGIAEIGARDPKGLAEIPTSSHLNLSSHLYTGVPLSEDATMFAPRRTAQNHAVATNPWLSNLRNVTKVPSIGNSGPRSLAHHSTIKNSMRMHIAPEKEDVIMRISPSTMMQPRQQLSVADQTSNSQLPHTRQGKLSNLGSVDVDNRTHLSDVSSSTALRATKTFDSIYDASPHSGSMRVKGAPILPVTESDLDDSGGDGSDEDISLPSSSIRQRDLVAQAFASDHVVQDFQEEKRREAEKDAPKEIDTSLPGWGAWVGIGVKRKAKLEAGFNKRTKGIEPALRKDFGKKHVIISENTDVKGARYRLKDIPFPYTSKAQYERSLEVPLGSEWATRIGHQKATTPRIKAKIGTVIEPLERLF